MAAIAASPNGFAILFKIPLEIDVNPWRINEGNPTRQIPEYILNSLVTYLILILLWAVLR